MLFFSCFWLLEYFSLWHLCVFSCSSCNLSFVFSFLCLFSDMTCGVFMNITSNKKDKGTGMWNGWTQENYNTFEAAGVICAQISSITFRLKFYFCDHPQNNETKILSTYWPLPESLKISDLVIWHQMLIWLLILMHHNRGCLIYLSRHS